MCSIGQLFVDAHDRAAKGKATYDAAAKARSVIANVAAQNQALAEIGAPQMEATIAPGRATASVKVTGKMLAADFPLIARDWDPAANDRAPASIKAVGWIYADDAEHPPYRMSPSTRAKRPIGCSLCVRRAASTAARSAA